MILDAAMGTALIARGLDPQRESAASWCLTHPDEVLAVHRAHVAAGAELVLTNTFGRAAPSSAECEAALQLARESGARQVGASLWAGATDLARAAHDLRGADYLWLETATSVEQARAALAAVKTSLPVVLTFATCAPVRLPGATYVGMNCGPWRSLPQDVDVVKPDASGFAPEAWARAVAATGAKFVGGCCGTDARYLAALRAAPR